MMNKQYHYSIKSLGCWIWLRLQINSQFNHMPYPFSSWINKVGSLQPLHCHCTTFVASRILVLDTKTPKPNVDKTINVLFIIQVIILFNVKRPISNLFKIVKKIQLFSFWLN